MTLHLRTFTAELATDDRTIRGTLVPYGQPTLVREYGKTYTEDECVRMVLVQADEHASEIAPCLPDQLPQDTLGAFIDVTYTIGAPKFCASSMSERRLARLSDTTWPTR